MPLLPQAPPPIIPREGLVITQSGMVKAGGYLIPGPQGEAKAKGETIPAFPHAAITVRGDNLVVDFKGVAIEGTRQNTDPDQRKGLGIEVIGANVTIKNATIRGY